MSFNQLLFSLFAANKGTNPETAWRTAIKNFFTHYSVKNIIIDLLSVYIPLTGNKSNSKMQAFECVLDL